MALYTTHTGHHAVWLASNHNHEPPTLGMKRSPRTNEVAVAIPVPNVAPSTLMYSPNTNVHKRVATRMTVVILYGIADTSLESLSPLILTFLMLKARKTPINCQINL